jgi:glycerophosphoryl diester phosphodiesterase
MSLQQLKQLDAGFDFPDDHAKTHPYRGKGVVIPTLEEVYRAFPDVPLNFEKKEAQDSIELTLWQEIKAAEAEEHTLVVSKKMRVIDRFRDLSGKQVVTGSSASEIVAFILWSHLFPDWLLQPSYQALQVPKQIITPGFVQAAHRSDLRVDAWTVNTEPYLHRLLGYGVNGVMTDRTSLTECAKRRI